MRKMRNITGELYDLEQQLGAALVGAESDFSAGLLQAAICSVRKARSEEIRVLDDQLFGDDDTPESVELSRGEVSS